MRFFPQTNAKGMLFRSEARFKDVIAIFLYIITFVIITYPLILSFSSKMPGNSGDEYLMSWFFWEFYHYVFVLHKWPFFTNLAYYPHGVPIYVSTSMPVNSVIASVIYYFSRNLILSYNVVFFISFMLNAYFAYLLADETVKNKTASFFAGVIFAACPVLVEQARWGDINIWSAYGLPLYILFFNRLYNDPGIKNALLAAVGLFLATYAGFYEFTVMLMLYSIFFIFYRFFKEDKILRLKQAGLNNDNDNAARAKITGGRGLKSAANDFKNRALLNPVFNAKYLKKLALMISVFVVASSPFLIPAIYYLYIDKGVLFFDPDIFFIKSFSATLFAFFVPPFFNHLMLPFTKAVYFNPVYPFMARGANSLDFLGYVPIVFFIIAVAKGFKNIRFYFYAFLFFVLMSLSPLIHIVNNIRVFDPFVYLIDILPVFRGMEESGRYMIMGFLFFAIICAYGIKTFLDYPVEKLKHFGFKRHNFLRTYPVKLSIILLVFFGIVAGYSSYPFEMKSRKILKGIYILKKSKPYGAVLTIPFYQDGFKMYEQTIYQKPMISGYIIRYGFHNLYKNYIPRSFFMYNGSYYKWNGANQMTAMELGNPKNLAANLKYLKRLDVRYLIVVKNELKWAYNKKNDLNLERIDNFLASEGKAADIIFDSNQMMIVRLNY